MKRHQQILAGLLIIQIVLAAITFWPKSAATSGGKPVFVDLSTDDVVALAITDDLDTRISLRKVDGEWVLPDAGNYPAQAAKITPVLEKLAKLNTGNLVTRTDTSHKALQVAGDDFVRRIDVEIADGTTATVYLGSAPRYTATHFRVYGQVETYLTTDFSTWDLNTSAASWIDTAYVTIDAATLTEIVLENANGAFTLVKSGEEWLLAELADGDVIAPGKVNDVVSKVTRVTMQRPLGTEEESAYGFSAPAATVTLKTGDGGVYTLRIGGQLAGETNYIVKSSESAYYVVVAEFNVKPLVENAYADFIQEPTPTPAPAP
jgi:hypothetical protein